MSSGQSCQKWKYVRNVASPGGTSAKLELTLSRNCSGTGPGQVQVRLQRAVRAGSGAGGLRGWGQEGSGVWVFGYLGVWVFGCLCVHGTCYFSPSS